MLLNIAKFLTFVNLFFIISGTLQKVRYKSSIQIYMVPSRNLLNIESVPFCRVHEVNFVATPAYYAIGFDVVLHVVPYRVFEPIRKKVVDILTRVMRPNQYHRTPRLLLRTPAS